MIDRKFKFVAVNPVNGKTYTEENALILCAKDKAVVPALEAYASYCYKIGANQDHIKSVDMMIQRVKDFQQTFGCRIPDTIGGEIDRCIGGKF